jgi:hypothetical protein
LHDVKLAEGKLFESGGTRVAACSEVLNLSAFFTLTVALEAESQIAA